MSDETSASPAAGQGDTGSWPRSALFTVGQVMSTVLFAVASLFTAPLPYRARYRFITQWSRFNLWWLKVTCGLTFRVEGREHIPPGNGVVLCKHQSAFETFALSQVFPEQTWVLKRELLWIPFFGWGLALLRPIAIERKGVRRAVRALLSQGQARLRQGIWVVIFPEGTRTRPGQKGHYAPGGALLAHKSGYPVVPVAHNAGEYWPRRGFRKRPGTIRLVVGPPIDPAQEPAEINRQAEDWIEAKVAEISARVPASRQTRA